ncbi:hypothetical protein PSECIP111951_01118 [Pseudoalteromonas holothuriae]|uniref:DUF962 domain-containing protein n=1 Tax=Pseudoalteromonas holothuriae TaxID=2963714 RepID=A0A9W4QXE9_9GAMM|nr:MULTISPECIES: Mpo1-like protein [unclassified Pseudoalteromonas]CAH9054830.1 hypothetical protein PSECIP111951_01118 [Pseudoalteromonas sp. CIP111951]CAH9057524.1 hypothetical protein PSECIP111854_02015 [Pseudoalteromonas sp. CIP111854]
MKTLEQQLVNYAKYHRDKRNIATHFFGIPVIVIAVIFLLYIPILEMNTVILTPALIVTLLSCAYYIRLDFRLGALMSVCLALIYAGVKQCYLVWPYAEVWFYSIGVVLFVIGWVVQFIGHYFEGKKPAFVDDLMGLIIGPLFVVVEGLFLLGLMKHLEQQIIAKAGAYR